MSEKIVIGIAVIAFLVLSCFSPLHITMCGAVIIVAATYTYVLREERYQEKIEQLLRAKISLILFTCSGATLTNSTNTTVLIESIKEIGDAPDIYSSCALAIFNMDTMCMVEEALQRDLTDQQRKNLQKLLQDIKKLYKSIWVVTAPNDGEMMDTSGFMMQTIGRQPILSVEELKSVITRLKPGEITTLKQAGFRIRRFNPKKEDPKGSTQRSLDGIAAQKALA